MKNHSEVKEIIAARKIPYLLHFTKNINLDSIMEYGLVPRSKLDDYEIDAEINDHLRLDCHENAISVSIAFPNYKMFYKLRQETDDEWVVLIIESRALLDNKLAFCKHNAADVRISSTPLDELTAPTSFQGMFDEIDTERTRKDQKLKTYDPTDPQAEILVFGRIKPKRIAGVVFSNKVEKNKFKEKFPSIKACFYPENKGMYAARKYCREYK